MQSSVADSGTSVVYVLFQTKHWRGTGELMPKAECYADSLDGAFAAFNLWDDRVVWDAESSWSASVGDYIMDPSGDLHKIEPVGFKKVNFIKLCGGNIGLIW